jgi:hypothetical protein
MAGTPMPGLIVTCPNCHHEFEQTVRWKPSPTFTAVTARRDGRQIEEL